MEELRDLEIRQLKDVPDPSLVSERPAPFQLDPVEARAGSLRRRADVARENGRIEGYLELARAFKNARVRGRTQDMVAAYEYACDLCLYQTHRLRDTRREVSALRE